MERLTHKKGDMVYYRKDGQLLAPVNMSGFDVKQALSRLAELEDAIENGQLTGVVADGED